VAGAAVIAVIFEVQPADGKLQDYLDAAAHLRPLLEQIDGFLSIERFQSLSQPGKILSLSFWRDEEAVKQWRKHAEHRLMQQAGRGGLFEDYRLRVAEVARDYGLHQRTQVPEDLR
jgi:heme-degrading monooxygenase HmoA